MELLVIYGFEEKVKAFLDSYAKSDETFGKKYAETEKTIKGCCSYVTKIVREQIMSQFKPSYGGNIGQIEDDAVYQMAITYFMEDSIKEEKKKESTTPKPSASTTSKGTKVAKIPTDQSGEEKKKEEKKSGEQKLVQLSLF